MKSRYIFRVTALWTSEFISPAGSWACAVCGLDDSAYIVSYLFMTGMPLAIVGLVGGVFIFSLRRRKNNSSGA
jgi:hypothetical protein